MEKTVYLSGPITGLTYGNCTDWRDYAEGFLSSREIKGISPMRGKDYLAGTGIITDGQPEVLANAMSQDQAIVTRDRWDTRRCDFMLCNLLGAKSVSIGTVVEIGWADAFRVPVVLVMEKTGNIHEHAFVRQLTGYRVETLDEGLHLIAAALS